MAKPTPFAMPENRADLQGEQLREPSSPCGLLVPCRVHAGKARPRELSFSLSFSLFFFLREPHTTQCSCQPTPCPGTSGLVLLHSLLLVAVAEGSLQPLGGGALLEAQHLLRAVPQGPVLCKGCAAWWGHLRDASCPAPQPGPTPQSPTAQLSPWRVYGGCMEGMAPPCTLGEGFPAPSASSSITVQKMGAEFPSLLLSLSHPSSDCPCALCQKGSRLGEDHRGKTQVGPCPVFPRSWQPSSPPLPIGGLVPTALPRPHSPQGATDHI